MRGVPVACFVNTSSSSATMARRNDVERSATVLKDTQARVLPKGQLIVVFAAVSSVMFLSFLDQTAATTAVPSIAADLHIGSSISWVTGSYLAASTSTQLIVGRLSDIFGRKATLIASLALMAFGELMVGFAQNEIWLYACRAVAGLGAGSLNSQAQIVTSDITTLKQRGNLIGITGVAVALGNGLGPIFGGLLTQHIGWRWVFWIIAPIAAVCIVVLSIVVPRSGRNENIRTRLELVDWVGVVLTLAGTFLVLIPISQGGSTFPFDSAQFIALLVIGVILFAIFVFYEQKYAKIPVIPMHLFATGYAANAFLWQNIGFGWIFWSNLYFLPIYFQNVQGHSPSRAGVLILPLVVANGLVSALAGYLISKSGRYLWSMLLGTGLWTIGLACQAALYGPNTNTLTFALIGVFQGIGVGFSFQPNLIGVYANTYRRDRAVVTSLRAFLRALGGAIGTAVGNSILNNTIRSGLQGVVPESDFGLLASATAALEQLNLNSSQQALVRTVYMQGIHTIFITFAPIMGVCFLCHVGIRDRGLQQLGEAEEAAKSSEEEPGSTNVEKEESELEQRPHEQEQEMQHKHRTDGDGK